MSKRRILFILSLVALLSIPNAYAETLDLNSYYPSPFGSYDRLLLVPRAPEPTCNQYLEGLIYFNNVEKELFVCQFDPWTGVWGGRRLSTVWTQDTSSNVAVNYFYPTDVNRYDINVGIGTNLDKPNYKLHLRPQSNVNLGMDATSPPNSFMFDTITDAGNPIPLKLFANNIRFDTGGMGNIFSFENDAVMVNGGQVTTFVPGIKLEVRGPSLFNSENADLDASNISYLLNSDKLLLGWNRSGGGGETDFIANSAISALRRGFSFYDYFDPASVNLLFRMNGSDRRVGMGNVPNPLGHLHISYLGGVGFTNPARLTLTNLTPQGSAELTLGEFVGAGQDGFRIFYYSSTSGLGNWLQFKAFNNNQPGTAVMSLDRDSFNVGIGIEDPLSKLHLSDTGAVDLWIEADTDNNPGGEFDQPSLTVREDNGQTRGALGFFDGSNDLTLKTTSNHPLIFGTRNIERMRITNNGNNSRIGIATFPAGAYKLDVRSGNVNAQNGGYRHAGNCVGGLCASDRRLKNDIRPLSNSLEKIKQLKPVDYKFINPEYGSGKQTSLIAQDVEQIFPEWVVEDEQGIKRIKYGLQIPMHLIEAVKELKMENDKLWNELETLKAKVD